MALSKYTPTTRVSTEKITLRNGQFAAFMAARTGVSKDALAKALAIIINGVTEALAEGYDVHFIGMGTFQTRELKPRLRYHRLNKTRYMSEPSTMIHFYKSDVFTQRVRKLALQRLEQIADRPHVSSK